MSRLVNKVILLYCTCNTWPSLYLSLSFHHNGLGNDWYTAGGRERLFSIICIFFDTFWNSRCSKPPKNLDKCMNMERYMDVFWSWLSLQQQSSVPMTCIDQRRDDQRYGGSRLKPSNTLKGSMMWQIWYILPQCPQRWELREESCPRVEEKRASGEKIWSQKVR